MPAYIQSAQSTGTGTSLTVSFSNNTRAGHAIVVAGRIGANSPTASCTDSQGNSYIHATGNYNSGPALQADIFVTANSSAAADTITYRSTVSGTISVAIQEYSGLVAVNSLIVDPTGVASAIDPGGAGNTNPSSGFKTPTNNSTWLFGAIAWNGTATYTPSNMGTNVQAVVRQTIANKLVTQDNVAFVSAAYQANGTFNVAENWNSLFITLCVGEPLYPQTAAEVAAGVTPLDFAYLEMDPRRYGAAGDGSTDDTVALNKVVSVVNAYTGANTGQYPVMNWPTGQTYLCNPLNNITASNLTWNCSATILSKPTSTTTQLMFTGSVIRIFGLQMNGNQFAFTSGVTSYFIEFSGNNVLMQGCSLTNGPSGIVLLNNISQGEFVDCHFDNNAGTFQAYTSSQLQFVNCTFNLNGYPFPFTGRSSPGVPTPGNGFGLTLRYRCHHVEFVNCESNQCCGDGFNVNQGSYAIKFFGCVTWMNGDGGFTVTNDYLGQGYVGDGEPCYDLEYVNCEAYNNWASGISAYSQSRTNAPLSGTVFYPACFNVQVTGGRYYNNNRSAGIIAPQSSIFNGVYFGGGCLNILVDTVSYDDRQLCAITSVSTSSGVATLTASHWGLGVLPSGSPGPTFVTTAAFYPRVALYNASLVFQGYGTITAESSGSLNVVASKFTGTASEATGTPGIVTVSAVASGTITAGDILSTVSGTMMGTVQAFGTSGTTGAGGTGTYAVSTSVSIASTTITANAGVVVANIATGWFVSQRVQHTGIFYDNACTGTMNNLNGGGFLQGYFSGLSPYKMYSGDTANGQNVWLPAIPFDSTPTSIIGRSNAGNTTTVTVLGELLQYPTWDDGNGSGATWTYSLGSGGGSAVNVQNAPPFCRSPGGIQLVGGGTGVSVGDGALITNAANYIQNCFVEATVWCYATNATDGYLILYWNSNGYYSVAYHPGGAWRLLKIGAFISTGYNTIGFRVVANVGKTVYFDNASLKVRAETSSSFDYLYPTRSLPI